MLKPHIHPELLAPAGNMAVLQAALASGANAVYLGMRHLNARNGAKNFTMDELKEAVGLAHQAGAKVYLTLNTDLSQRELGTAARSLAAASQLGVDAILVKDPALLLMHPYFPQIEFHFSTQAGVTTSKGVEAAKLLGLSRVVLARELTLQELQAASAVAEVETEAFVQGAICFSCSGHCLMSSWGGGRSGNRGMCTSPCRVAWTNEEQVEAHPLSMRDMCLVDWVEALRQAGVASFKIEGRLKSPEWVRRAVTLYRRALDGKEEGTSLRAEAESLGDYTGRDMTDGYLRGEREYLTATAARPSSRGTSGEASCHSEEALDELQITVTEDEAKATLFRFAKGTAEESYRIPPQRIANPRRAVPLSSIIEKVTASLGKEVVNWRMDESLKEKRLPKNTVNGAVDVLGDFLRQLSKEEDGLPRGMALPSELQAILQTKPVPSPENRLTLGDTPTRVRVKLSQWNRLTEFPGLQAIVEVAPLNLEEAENQWKEIQAHFGKETILSLPQVLYEGQLAAVEWLLRQAALTGMAVEVNSWDTWRLATEQQNIMEAGPGLAVLNALAAKQLVQLGCRCVSISPEIDGKQLQALTENVEVPVALTVFSYPALMTTRAILPSLFQNAVFKDGRNIQVRSFQEGAVTVLRPTEPMDWRGLRASSVKVAHLVLDITGAPDGALPSKASHPFLFNYDRRLR